MILFLEIVFKKTSKLFLPVSLFVILATGQPVSAQHAQNSVLHPKEVYSDTTHHLAYLEDPFFKHIDLHQINIHESERQPVWLFIILALQLALVAYLRFAFPREIEIMLSGLMNLNLANQLYRDQELSMPISAVLYNVNFVISAGIFLYLLNDHFGWSYYRSPFIGLLFFLWLAVVIFSLKYGSLKLISMVFPFGSAVDHYNFNFFLVQKIIGLLLIPVNFLFAYAASPFDNLSLITGLALMVILFMILIFKGIRIADPFIRQSIFHFVLYICILEIAPVCILLKVVAEWVN